jgi:uncharacterized protein with FMN-binding domain
MHRYRVIPALLTAAMAAIPIGNAWGTAHAATSGAHATKAKTKKYKGPSEDMRWGPVQATVSIKSKKITAVSISTSPENRRSQLIDDRAVPLLQQETLQAQSANIDTVSGATMTSEAFIQSLQSALNKAHFKPPQGS